MRRSFGVRILCLALLCFACSSLYAQEFSADIVATENGKTQHNAKIYVIKNKMRVEGQDEKGQGGNVIINYDTQTMTMIMPQQHMYMEMKLNEGPMAQQHKFMFFQAIDVENACPDWQKMTDKPGRSCQKVGDDTVNGRPAVKYATTDADGKNGTAWIDKELKFPIKWQEPNSSGELQNIQVGSQPSSLFVAPAGYQKFDMGNMMGAHH